MLQINKLLGFLKGQRGQTLSPTYKRQFVVTIETMYILRYMRGYSLKQENERKPREREKWASKSEEPARMAAIICQEHSQALQGLPIDLTSERLLSGQHLLVHSLGEEAIAGASDACLELPRLTVCQPTGMEWKPVECSTRDCNDSLEQCGVNFMSVAEANHDINAVPIFLLHDAPLCASTPDVHQTSDCVNDHLSNQVTIYAEPKTKRHRSSSHAHTCQLMSKSQAGFNHTRSKSLNPESPLHKRIVCDFEKDLTFRPRLNEYSLKLASKSTRNSVPVVHRLLEARKNVPDPSDHRLTFAPKLNPVSLKMAQERAAKMPEVSTIVLVHVCTCTCLLYNSW